MAVYQEQFKYNVDQTLTLVDFDDEQMRRFLRAWKDLFPPDHSREQLITSLRERPQILQMARNPLILTLITSLYTDPTFVLPHSRLEFYNKVTDRLLELRDQERPYLEQHNNYRLFEKKSILKRLALYAQNNPDKLGSERKSLSFKTVREEVKKELSSLSRTDNDIIPIVLGYSSYAFYDWFGLTWQEITIIWIAILGVCTVLWQWGQKLDYEARNPFKGILDSVKSDNNAFN